MPIEPIIDSRSSGAGYFNDLEAGMDEIRIG
jgi:hypothetical protein